MLTLSKSWEEYKLEIITCILVSDYLEVVIYFVLFFTNINFFHDFIFHESEIRTVLLEVSIEL